MEIDTSVSWLENKTEEESKYFGIIDLHSNHWMRNESKIALRVNKIYDILNKSLFDNLISNNNITFEKFKHKIFITLYEMKENKIIDSFILDMSPAYNQKMSFKVSVGFFGDLKGKITIMDITGINISENKEHPEYYFLHF